MNYKKCTRCSEEYHKDHDKCPKCGSVMFRGGFGPLTKPLAPPKKEEPTSNDSIFPDIVVGAVEIALAGLSGAAEVVGNTFSTISDIDFGGGGASDLFD